MVDLGNMLINNMEKPEDGNKAASWFLKASKLGNPEAQDCMGFMYGDGMGGLKKDPKTAAEYFRKSAEQGYALGQTHYGYSLAKGQGVDRNYTEALEWYRKAAAQDEPLAKNNMGDMYTKGMGVKRDDKEAVKWYKKAAEKNLPMALNSLGDMYEGGFGVKKDVKEAVKYYKKAAELGNHDAKISLANHDIGIPAAEK
jgi:hypothetical protein